MRWFLFFIATRLYATSALVQTTATDAVLTYQAPSGAACDVVIRDSASNLVHDVDTALFAGSNLDSRAGGVSSGTFRVFHAGKGANAVPPGAEKALDNRWYSRAFEANAVFTYALCSGTVTGSFRTMNSPLGNTRGQTIPVDPANPGEYAWPSIDWNDRTQIIIDPYTGMALKNFVGARDSYQATTGTFASPAVGTNWTNPNNVLVDDSLSAVYAAPTKDQIFVPLGLNLGPSNSVFADSLNKLTPSFNAWCSGVTCGAATSNDRSIETCVTADRATCVTDRLASVLTACSSSCTGGGFRFAAITSPTAIMTEWFASTGGLSTLLLSDLSTRSGTVTRVGTAVTRLSGDRFNLKWGAGSIITINAVDYTIASVTNPDAIVLASGASTDTAVAYTASNGGILIRKKTTSTDEISIQYVSWALETGDHVQLESAGDEDEINNCSGVLVNDAFSEPGHHCFVSTGIYWHGSITGKINRLGQYVTPFNGGNPGWLQHPCDSGAFWDAVDGNTFYCPVLDPNVNQLRVLKVVYTGSNADIGDLASGTAFVACGSAPCFTITNLHPTIGVTLDTQIAAFNPSWAVTNFRAERITIYGRMANANALLFLVRRGAGNNSNCYLAKFDVATAAITAMMNSYGTYPSRWQECHGPFDPNNPNWVQMPGRMYTGPFTGTDVLAGNGPYYATITSGSIPNTGSACPAQPGGSTIPPSEWPTGSKCLVVTLDGEPGDPTPAQYATGTVTTSGSTVTGSGTTWTPFMNGTQMYFSGSGTFCRFAYVSATSGTLSACSVPSVSGVAYVLYLEEVNSSKLPSQFFSYLQDAAERDIICLTATIASSECEDLLLQPYPTGKELLRVLIKTGSGPGTILTLQRGYAGPNMSTTYSAVGANSKTVFVPSACNWNPTYLCLQSPVWWNPSADPFGTNPGGNAIVADILDQGCCHATRQNNINVDGSLTCPTVDGSNSSCYLARNSGPPAGFTDPGYIVSFNPTFHQKAGVGFPNSVDSHPSHQQFTASTFNASWFSDGRPFLGADGGNYTSGGLFGTAGAPGVLVSGQLYKWTAAQADRHRPRYLNSIAAIGWNPLLDISGPGSSIGTSDNYKMCTALFVNECRSGSSVGDVFVAGPQITDLYCTFPGVGNDDTDRRDVCVGDVGTFTFSTPQISVTQADFAGQFQRRVTNWASYKDYTFKNSKILPDGKSLLFWVARANGVRNTVMIAKLPPWTSGDSTARNDYQKLTVRIPAGTGANNAIVKFGYNSSFYCTSRQEACIAGSAAEFSYASEAPAGVNVTACPSTGCPLIIPALPQSVVYSQLILRDASNITLTTYPMEIRAVQ